MTEIKCQHTSCRCTISSQSPGPFCCDVCEHDPQDEARCECGHEACGGITGDAADAAREAKLRGTGLPRM